MPRTVIVAGSGTGLVSSLQTKTPSSPLFPPRVTRSKSRSLRPGLESSEKKSAFRTDREPSRSFRPLPPIGEPESVPPLCPPVEAKIAGASDPISNSPDPPRLFTRLKSTMFRRSLEWKMPSPDLCSKLYRDSCFGASFETRVTCFLTIVVVTVLTAGRPRYSPAEKSRPLETTFRLKSRPDWVTVVLVTCRTLTSVRTETEPEAWAPQAETRPLSPPACAAVARTANPTKKQTFFKINLNEIQSNCWLVRIPRVNLPEFVPTSTFRLISCRSIMFLQNFLRKSA